MNTGTNRLITEHKKTSERGYFIDNLRFILIFSVVLGHLLENAAPFKGSIFLYKTIYSFHMPAFLFIFGYFIKYNPKRLVFHWIIPYLCFQTFYIYFHRMVLDPEIGLQYTMPYWALWYMMVCIFYQILLPLVDVDSKRKQGIILLLSVCAALYIGFDSSVGYFMALSRTIVFLPWFLLGLYFRKNGGFDSFFISTKVTAKRLLISIGFCFLSSVFIYKSNVSVNLLFGASSYSACGETMWKRAITMIIALNWIVLLSSFAKLFMKTKIPFITSVGQCTLPVFLLHGVMIKSIPRYWPILLSTPIYVLLVTFLVLLILGNKWMKKVVYYLGFSWLEEVVH